jgi:hypothetical protein
MNQYAARKVTFLQWFLGMLALFAGLFYATAVGFTGHVWSADESHVTAVIVAVTFLCLLRLGYISWILGEDNHNEVRLKARWPLVSIIAFPLLGVIGTTIGFSMQADAIVTGGGAGVSPLSTSLFTVMFGAGACIIVLAAWYNVKHGVDTIRMHGGEEIAWDVH